MIVGFEKVSPVAQLAVHKKKVAEVSNWLKEFPHHRKVVLSGNMELTVETACAIGTCWSGKVDYGAEFGEKSWRTNH